MLALLIAGAATADLRAALPTLTTAHEARSLTLTEARRGYPVHLRAVVTFYDAFIDPRHIALYVHDYSGSIFISVPQGSMGPMPAGSLVDVQAITDTGDFAPILSHAKLRRIGRSQLPAAGPPASFTDLLTGSADGRWVEVDGVVRSVYETEHNIDLQVMLPDGLITANLPREPGAGYSGLVDARVSIRANAGPIFNSYSQEVGVRLLVPNLAALKVEEPARSNPFDLPVRPVAGVLRFDPSVTLPRRIHLQGRVTLQWPGSSICIRDGTRGLCAQTLQTTPLELGELADVVGFASTVDGVPALTGARFQRAGSSRLQEAPMQPVPLTAEDALEGKHDSELVRIDGLLIGRDFVAADTTLILASGKFIFAAVLPRSLADASVAKLKDGTALRLTGIWSVQIDTERSARSGGTALPKSFRILLRLPADLVVLHRASWWTPRHALLLVSLVLAVTLLVLGWVVALRKRVDEQTRVIRESEERFRHMAQHDALTGLPSRVLLHDRLDAALARSTRYNTGLALLMLDLDNFKLINDTMGHQAGDQTLRETATRITNTVRKTDTVARMGGDEFVVLLTDLKDAKEAEVVAGKIVAALSVPIAIGERLVPVTVSVGVCTSSGGGIDGETLLKSVDTAMYHAKAQGRNCFQLFTADMARATVEKMRLQAGLGRAMELKELELHYQPMVSFDSGELTGFEALLRWRGKGMEMIMPEDFIPLAEESGLIVPIGEWVLREACREIGLLEQQMNRTFLLSVNLSPRQFQQDDLPLVIARALANYERSPGSIEFEITESMLMTDSAMTHRSLMELRNQGVQLAIDDFGIGFSSLSYITRFSIDRIKIDRSFITNCTTDGNSLAVIRAIIAMAHGLYIQVVAEGVETGEQFRFLREELCDTAQGYYLSPPVPAADLPRVLREIEQTTAAATHRDPGLTEGVGSVTI